MDATTETERLRDQVAELRDLLGPDLDRMREERAHAIEEAARLKASQKAHAAAMAKVNLDGRVSYEIERRLAYGDKRDAILLSNPIPLPKGIDRALAAMLGQEKARRERLPDPLALATEERIGLITANHEAHDLESAESLRLNALQRWQKESGEAEAAIEAATEEIREAREAIVAAEAKQDEYEATTHPARLQASGERTQKDKARYTLGAREVGK